MCERSGTTGPSEPTRRGDSRRHGGMALGDLDDRALLAAARAGDAAAYGELWQRHRGAALSAARATSASLDPEDLVADASAIVFEAIRRGAGPQQEFRPYLFAVVRNLARTRGRARRELTVEVLPEPAIDDVLDGRIDDLERSLILEAFRSLPPRWRDVLWYTEVEGLGAAEVGSIVGLRPNATAALAYRAREGLRRAWLQAHIAQATGVAECQWALERLGEHARDGLRQRAAGRMDAHLASCRRCRDVALEIRQLEHCLASILIVATLGGTAACWSAVAGGTAGATAVAGGLTTGVTTSVTTGVTTGAAASATGGVAVAAIAAAAAVLVTVGISVSTVSPELAEAAGPEAARHGVADAVASSGPGQDALRAAQDDPLSAGAAHAAGASTPSDAAADAAGPGGAADPLGLGAVVEATTGVVSTTVNETVAAVGAVASGATGGAVDVAGAIDLGTAASPGVAVDVTVDVGLDGLLGSGGLLGLDLALHGGGSGLDVGVGIGVPGGAAP